MPTKLHIRPPKARRAWPYSVSHPRPRHSLLLLVGREGRLRLFCVVYLRLLLFIYLQSCKSAACECTQDNYDKLGVCINCLVALGPLPQYDAPGQDYLDS